MKMQNLSWGSFHKKLEQFAEIQTSQAYYYFSETGNLCSQSRNWMKVKRAFCIRAGNSDGKVISKALTQFLE
ncbi:MAG: hypothetical protein ACI9S8_000859 [Chlamydiales bacterium]|jgi:hypothetical protein